MKRERAKIRTRPTVPFTEVCAIIDEYETAARTHEMAGSHHPLQMKSDELRYVAARRAVEEMLKQISREQWEIVS